MISKVAAQGVRVYGMSAYCLGRPKRIGVMLGYSRMGEAQIRKGFGGSARCCKVELRSTAEAAVAT
jgi:DNA-binding transcriptional MocR family regulator